MSAPPPSRTSVARATTERLLGPAAPYILHLRPMEWPILAGHLALGWLLAAGLHLPDGHALLAMAAWVVGLNGGTLALNSAIDRDTDDIAYLKRPPPAPTGLAGFGLGLMLAGLVLTWHFGEMWRGMYALCVVMSMAYSLPPLRLKRVAGLDWLINVLGFGAFTPLAGWAITGRILEPHHALVLWGFAPLFGALYPLTQLYQLDADRGRGDVTTAARLGVRRSLTGAIALVIIAFAMFGLAAWQVGWPSLPGLRWSALAVAAMAWMVVLLPWREFGSGWTSADHQRGMYHALTAWALTDAALVIAWVF